MLLPVDDRRMQGCGMRTLCCGTIRISVFDGLGMNATVGVVEMVLELFVFLALCRIDSRGFSSNGLFFTLSLVSFGLSVSNDLNLLCDIDDL